ncbi:NAD-dependent epimerase/dehydratase family protein [Methyloceanibacter caenitepidi]|uniref:UDP-glucose 4-epimerase n=1 Tax=Methyloceanibacter caenitepidi TaxID=1384459 RepID=A0A0A8K0B1_9HYPH|nr:NAD-dependent epimerase/dehydratase family protein [Methyloceanibacter caenitepidi]BAQ16393.1 UDP-glucose 4-epimerase [Methyloceanibacter caenitepidi]
MRILVTGATGFIGQSLVPALARQGTFVRAAARDPSRLTAGPNIEPIAMPDLSGPVDWTSALEDVSHVVHLAGIAHAPGTLPDEIYARINTEAVGELAEQAKGKIARFVLMSSVRAQAGLSSPTVITEADEPAPTEIYGRTKLDAERRLAASGVDYTVLRPAVVYGPNVKGNIASLATIAKTPMPLPFGGLDNRRSLLSIDNLIAAVAHVLQTEETLNQTYLVADAEPISVAGMVAAMREGLGRPPQLVKMPHKAIRRLMKSFGREADWERVCGTFEIDPAKLIATGWKPEIDSAEGIKQMMRAPQTPAP